MSRYALAVDIGATKAALGIVTDEFKILDKIEVPTGAGTAIWQNIEGASRKLLSNAEGKCLGVGIGSAGPLHLDAGEISPVNIPNWRKFPIVKNFSNLVGTENVVLHGDAMALAHAEYRLGAGQDSQNMFGMVVSTGIGGGLVLDGKLFTGVTGNASYFGHHSISFEGKKCVCGRIGCVETYASGPKMVEYALEIGWQHQHPDFKNLAEDARNGNKHALESINRGSRALANAIVNVLDILDINTVVIGGGVSESGEIYWKPLREHVLNEAKFAGFLSKIDLRPAKLDRDAGLLGAALGVLDNERE
jgi:glucokinase